MNQLGVYKTVSQALLPKRATGQAACYDVHACLMESAKIQVWNEWNEASFNTVVDGKFIVHCGERVLVPTGLIFDIPEGFSVRLHPRSGISIKQGVTLINCEGVVDSDYYHETLVALINHSGARFTIHHGDRIAQIELVKNEPLQLTELSEAPQARTLRQGGFGSTGLSS
jgi:dUTP pyrophosphatase